jgi:hypothetical protein
MTMNLLGNCYSGALLAVLFLGMPLHTAEATLAKPVATVIRPTPATVGPRPDQAPTVTYKKEGNGDWRLEDGKTKAPFNFANGHRDLIVHPGDKIVFKRVKFDGHLNIGPVWNYPDGSKPGEAEILIEDCLISGGLSISTAGKMQVMISHSSILGGISFCPSPESLITADHVSIVAADGGDAARINRQRNLGKYPYGPDSRTPVTMKDCIIKTTGPTKPGDHRDAMQVFGGIGISFTNVVFDLNSGEYPGIGNGQNAALFIEDGSNGSVGDIDIIDCWFIGSGSYHLMGIQRREGSTSRNINLIRPRLQKGITPLYKTDFPAFQNGIYKLESPIYSDDLTPVPLASFGLSEKNSPPPMTTDDKSTPAHSHLK